MGGGHEYFSKRRFINFFTSHVFCCAVGEMPNVQLKKKGGGYGLMLSGFITKDGFLVLTEEDVHNINAQRAMKGTYLDSNANNETEKKEVYFL